MEYRNPKYEKKVVKKWRTNSVSTKFVHFWVVSVSKYMVKKYLIFDRFDFLCRFFSRFLNNFFGRTKFTRSSSDKPVLQKLIINNFIYWSPKLLFLLAMFPMSTFIVSWYFKVFFSYFIVTIVSFFLSLNSFYLRQHCHYSLRLNFPLLLVIKLGSFFPLETDYFIVFSVTLACF